MTELNLPEKLDVTEGEKNTDSVKLPVPLTHDQDISAEAVDQLIKDLGHVQINGARLKALHSLGCAAEQIGILRTLKGGVIVSADSLVQAIGRIEKELDTPEIKLKEKVELSKTLAYLTNAYIRLSQGAVKMDVSVINAVTEQDKARRNTFAPGKRVSAAPITV
jgi:hypothetical protein